jgi:Flp pilus assembly protein TadG
MLLRRFHKNKRGVAAVEFALLLPVMITLFFGVVEISLMLNTRAAVNNVASITADLVAQRNVMSGSDMTNTFNAAGVLLYPNPPAKATIEVYSITDNGTAKGKVAWSCQMVNSQIGTGPTTVPKDADGNDTKGGEIIAQSNLDPTTGAPKYGGTGSVIIGKIIYPYTPIYGTGDRQMISVFYTRPRRVPQIAAPASCS